MTDERTASYATGDALLTDLRARGLLHQATQDEALVTHLQTSRFVYAGFDPTADSLTIGNLVSILLLRRFQLAGHTPVVVMGGGTGLIGDPSGKDAERTLKTDDDIKRNIEGQRPIFERVLDFDGPHAARIRNNADWIGALTYVQVLRDVGKHFSVNMMIQKDSVKARLQGREHGISYTEFSYMILQAYDFAHLTRTEGVTLQVGGSDQWGNIVAGVDLTRRLENQHVFGLTTPLITKSDGGKFGKTESGAIWLTSDKTSAYAFYQFWINTADADIERFLYTFSLRPISEIVELLERQALSPGQRPAQRALAEEVTRIVHGEAALLEAVAASEALFSGNVASLSADLLDEVFQGAPDSQFDKQRLAPDGVSAVDLLVESAVAKSKREARQFLQSGAVSINGSKVDAEFVLKTDGLLHDRLALIRRGKKTWHVCRFSG